MSNCCTCAGYHEMNLDWLINQIKIAIKEWTEMQKKFTDLNSAFEDLKEYINNYFDNLDVQEEINNKLDEMYNDGTLANIIDTQLFNSIKFNQVFVADEDQNAFINDMLSCAVSYLVNSMGSDSVVGTPTGRNKPFVAKYSDGNTYMGVLGQGKFISTDTEIFEGVSYPIVYIDCSGFISLLTKCRDYVNSTYYAAFNGESMNSQISKAYEAGTTVDKPYTLDFLQNIATFQEAYYLQKSGCPLHKLSQNVNNELNVDSNAFSNLTTGDILFFSTPSLSNRYKGIHHCAIYVKTLEELNVYGEPYGVTFQKGYIPENDNDQYGFIIDAGGFVDEPNVIKISSLYSRMKYTANEITYFIHPVSSCFNSTKAMNYLLGISPSYDSIYFVERRQNRFGWIWNGIKISQDYASGDNNIKGDSITVNTIDVTCKNITSLGSNIDLNRIPNGAYICDTAETAQSIQNSPYNNTPFELLQFGAFDAQTDSQRYGVQIAFQQSNVNPTYAKYRVSIVDGSWHEWLDM